MDLPDGGGDQVTVGSGGIPRLVQLGQLVDEVGGISQKEVELLQVVFRREVRDERVRWRAGRRERPLACRPGEAGEDEKQSGSIDLQEALWANPMNKLRGNHHNLLRLKSLRVNLILFSLSQRSDI